MSEPPWKVGELARRTGLSVRTLHWYDEVGLLRPSHHSDSGYRLYGAGDVERLQRILSLRQLGFSLEEIRNCLDRPDFAPLQVVRLHLARLHEHIRLQQRLCDRLEALAGRFESADAVSADEFLQVIEGMTMMEKYYTPEQLELIKTAREQLGEEYLRQKQEEWAELIALVRAEMEKGTDPADAKVQALAQRWTGLLNFTTGGDPGMEQAIKRHWEEQGDAIAAQYGSQYDSRPIWGYISRAVAAAKSTAPGAGPGAAS
jgi:DNA-binding transcriptional MerR regulator